jgi:hypothetical protein
LEAEGGAVVGEEEPAGDRTESLAEVDAAGVERDDDDSQGSTAATSAK